MRVHNRLAAVVGACAIVVGVTACSGDDDTADPSNDPSDAMSAGDATSDDTADDPLAVFVGDWEYLADAGLDEPVKVGALTIDADGNVTISVTDGVCGGYTGTVVSEDEPLILDVESNNPEQCSAEEFELTYDEANDTALVDRGGDEPIVYTRAM